MKAFEKFILNLFSVIMLLLVIFIILISTEIIDVNGVLNVIVSNLISHKLVVLVVGALTAFAGLVVIFAPADSNDDARSGLAIKNEAGTIYLNRDTFENMIMSITKSYPEIVAPKVDVNINSDGVVANIYAQILPDTVIPTLSAKLQENIKSVVKKQTTVEIKEANVRIKGVYIEPQKK